MLSDSTPIESQRTERLLTRKEQRELTLRAYSDDWLKKIKKGALKPAAKISYELQIKHLMEDAEKENPLFANLLVGALDTDDPNWIFDFHERLERFVAGKLAQDAAPRSVRNMLQCLYKMLADLEVKMVITRNPMQGKIDQFRLNRPKVPDAERVRAMTQEQLDAFLSAARWHQPYVYHLWLFLARTGCRTGEACALTWDDIDIESRKASITKSLYIHDSIATAEPLTPKTETSNRRVTLSTGLCEGLMELYQIRRRQAREWGLTRVPRIVFCQTVGKNRGGYRSTGNLAEMAATTCKAAGLPRFTANELRHTYATMRICKNHNIQEISRELGHASTQITLETYGKWYYRVDREAVDSLDEGFNGTGNMNFSQPIQFLTQ